MSNMFERKEQQIREQRTIDAMREGIMGFEGKLCRIARTFGEEIWRQGSPNFEATELEDPWLLEDDEIPTMNIEDDMSCVIGWQFDGMRRGIHMEILWKDEFRELKCYYKGRLVYREVGGELDGYVPHDEWHAIVNDLFEQAKKKERQNRKVQHQVVNVEAKRQHKEFLDAMKQKWGI